MSRRQLVARGYEIACYVAIIASVAVLARSLFATRDVDPPPSRRTTETAVVRELLERTYVDTEGGLVRPADLEKGPLVLFLFNPSDCASSLPELEELDRLAREEKGIRLLAVMSYSNEDEARQTRENFGLEVPILLDPEGEVLSLVSPKRTPWRMVVELPEGRVLEEGMGVVDPAERQPFLDRLRSL